MDNNNMGKIDDKKIEQAVSLFLEAIGEDKNREGLKETPMRIARMAHELFAPLDTLPLLFDKVFTATGSEMVLEKDIPFYSLCEHHLLPFFGVCHIAYIPNGKVLGLSKIARVADLFARRPQIQENMTIQIADAFTKYLAPKGVMVAIEAEHLCLAMRGIKKPSAKTITYASQGVFSSDEKLQKKFFSMIKGTI